jgi:hypothetical protein
MDRGLRGRKPALVLVGSFEPQVVPQLAGLKLIRLPGELAQNTDHLLETDSEKTILITPRRSILGTHRYVFCSVSIWGFAARLMSLTL